MIKQFRAEGLEYLKNSDDPTFNKKDKNNVVIYRLWFNGDEWLSYRDKNNKLICDISFGGYQGINKLLNLIV